MNCYWVYGFMVVLSGFIGCSFEFDFSLVCSSTDLKVVDCHICEGGTCC